MTKLFLKSTLFTLLLSAVAVVSKAQIGYDYAQYDLGLGGAYNTVYGDAESLKIRHLLLLALITTKPLTPIIYLSYKPAV